MESLDKASRFPTWVTEQIRLDPKDDPVMRMYEVLPEIQRNNVKRKLETIMNEETMDMKEVDFLKLTQKAELSQPTNLYRLDVNHYTRWYNSAKARGDALYVWYLREKEKHPNLTSNFFNKAYKPDNPKVFYEMEDQTITFKYPTILRFVRVETIPCNISIPYYIGNAEVSK